MQILEAALAFAITMLVLSILCSTLVETIHRILGMREKGFRKMTGELFDHVLAGYAGNNPTAKEEFQARMTALRSPVGLTSSFKSTAAPATIWGMLFDRIATLWRGRGLSEQTATGFMERLGSDPLGEELVNAVKAAVPGVAGAAPTAAQIEQAVNTALQDVALKFEAFSKEASVFFERRARLLSVCVAMVVALALHVDAVNLFKSLVTNSAARAAVLAMQDEAVKAHTEVQKRIEQATKDAQKKNGSTNSTANPPTNLKELGDIAREAQANMQQTLDKLQATGASIGWSAQRADDAQLVWKWHRKQCLAPDLKVLDLKADACSPPNAMQDTLMFGIPTNFQMWIGLILGGLLIGLGGPFWTDTISNLTRVRDAARNIPGVAAPTGAGPGGQAPTPQPKTPVDAFKVSSGAI